jgi:hypothetical protein
MSLDRASRVRGTSAPDLAISVLLSSKKEFQMHVMAEHNQGHTMCCKICYASDHIALHLRVGTKHLTYEGFEPAQLNNEQLILSWSWVISRRELRYDLNPLFVAKLSRAAPAARWTSVS